MRISSQFAPDIPADINIIGLDNGFSWRQGIISTKHGQIGWRVYAWHGISELSSMMRYAADMAP